MSTSTATLLLAQFWGWFWSKITSRRLGFTRKKLGYRRTSRPTVRHRLSTLVANLNCFPIPSVSQYVLCSGNLRVFTERRHHYLNAAWPFRGRSSKDGPTPKTKNTKLMMLVLINNTQDQKTVCQKLNGACVVRQPGGATQQAGEDGFCRFVLFVHAWPRLGAPCKSSLKNRLCIRQCGQSVCVNVLPNLTRSV
jgi:hypothetical protein